MSEIPQGIHAFTTRSPRLVESLVNQISVGKAFDPDNEEPPNPREFIEFSAIWDTGATCSCIDDDVILKCGLKSASVIDVYTASGKDRANVYWIALRLPGRVGIPRLRVTGAKLSGNEKVLIGMDVIQMGDFAVSNFKELTSFSFRMPSQSEIDFVKDFQSSKNIKKPHRRKSRKKMRKK